MIFHICEECAFEVEPPCEADAHEWAGEGGCDENPGVWSLGGTTLVFRERCEHCGVLRKSVCRGSQRNPGEQDTRTYEFEDES